MDERKRKQKQQEDIENGFRLKNDPNQFETIEENTLDENEQLLSAANQFILNTDEKVIQSKIRSLLVGTELEEIAKTAQIIIHIQEDAKDYLQSKIKEHKDKLLMTQTLGNWSNRLRK